MLVTQEQLSQRPPNSRADNLQHGDEDQDQCMLHVIVRLLRSSKREIDARSLKSLQEFEWSATPYADFMRLCLSGSTDMKKLSDDILCEMQEVSFLWHRFHYAFNNIHILAA